MFKRFFLIILFITSLIPLLAFAQKSDYDILLDDARDQIAQFYWKQAEETLHKAMKINPDRTEAYMELGKLLMREKKWHDAKPYINKVIKKEPDNIEAHYQMAIADREDAIGRDQIWMRIMWKNSKKHFLKVISLDSTYKNVFDEFAKLKLQQEEYEDAINLGLKQLRIKPNDTQAGYDIFKYYDAFLYHGGETAIIQVRDKNVYQINWLKKRNGPYDRYFLGEKYRRLGQFQKADSIFQRLLIEYLPYPKVPIYLSLVRLYYQTDKPKLAEQMYWKAVDSVTEYWEMRFLFDDLKYLMTDKDLTRRFSSLQAVKKFYHEFWNKHNPLGSLPFNPRLEEHYKRLIKAEKDYIYDRPRLPINDPDRLTALKLPQVVLRNTKFNDKGLVYIRYGPPDDRAVSLSDGMASNESWLYYATPYNPKLIFHFEIAEHAPPGDWRLVAVPTDRRMLDSRMGWDPLLDRYMMAHNELEAHAALSELRLEATKTIPAAMERERPTWSDSLKPITLDLFAARFRSNDLKNDYLVWMGINLNSIDTAQAKNDTIPMEAGIAFYDSTWDELEKKIKNIPVVLDDTLHVNHNEYILPFSYKSKLNKLFVSTHVRSLNGDQLGGYKFALKYEPLPAKKLAISDLVLAYKVEPSAKKSPYTFHDLQIIPNPRMKFKKNELVYIYFELYNLGMKDGNTRYHVEQTVRPLKTGNVFTNLKRLFGIGTKEISVTRDQVGASKVASEYGAFDFSALPTGKKELIITVKDENTGQKVKKSVHFELVK